MIIPSGANIWRSGDSSLSASQIRSETAPARTANSPHGRRRAATRPPPSSAKSPSGVPPSASTPKTADQPEQDSYQGRPPFGNTTSTEASDADPTTSALTSQSAALLKALVIAGHQDRQHLPQPPTTRPNSPPRAGP